MKMDEMILAYVEARYVALFFLVIFIQAPKIAED